MRGRARRRRMAVTRVCASTATAISPRIAAATNGRSSTRPKLTRSFGSDADVTGKGATALRSRECRCPISAGREADQEDVARGIGRASAERGVGDECASPELSRVPDVREHRAPYDAECAQLGTNVYRDVPADVRVDGVKSLGAEDDLVGGVGCPALEQRGRDVALHGVDCERGDAADG